jgi:hypothetical protein
MFMAAHIVHLLAQKGPVIRLVAIDSAIAPAVGQEFDAVYESVEGMWTVLKRYNEHEQKTLNALEELLPDYTFYGLFKVTGR